MIIFIPLLVFLIIYIVNSRLMFKPIIPILNSSIISYILMGLCPGNMEFLYLRELKLKHRYILLLIRLSFLLIFMIFVPLQPFPLLGGIFSYIIFIILVGVVSLYIRQLVLFISKFFKNQITLYLLIMGPIIVFYTKIFFRIV